MVLGQKAGIFLHAIHAEGSIGGDMDAGIFGIVGVSSPLRLTSATPRLKTF